MTSELMIHIELLEDRLRRIRKIVEDAGREDDPVMLDIEEILREMDYDNQ